MDRRRAPALGELLGAQRAPLNEDNGLEQLEELVVGDRTETGAALELDVRRCVTALRDLGCAGGDRVAILLRNCREQLVATLSAQHIGAYAVQMNWHGQPAELLYVLGDCGARVLVAHTDLLARIAADLPSLRVVAVPPSAELRRAYRIDGAAAAVPEGAIAWDAWLAGREPDAGAPQPPVESIIYTSGTTGHPKGVRRFPATAGQQRLTEAMRLQVFGITAGSRVLVAAPIYHTAPHLFAMRAVRKAQALVLRPRFDPEAFLRDVEQHRITHAYVVPTIFVRLLALPDKVRARYDLSSLRFVLHAGGPCAPHLKKAMIDWWGPILHEYYGSTEAGPSTFCTSEDSLRRPGTVGRPVEGVRIEVHDDEGRALPAGEIGEILVRNDGYADFTYLNRQADRDALQRGDLMATGDLGYRDEEGYYYLSDRKRDLVISGGVNIYPAEIEAAILEVPGVADCAVFGIPDDEFGEALAALVEPQTGHRLQADVIAFHLGQRLAAFKVPRVIELREALPRDESGKIKKRLLREGFWQGQARRI